MLHAGSGSAKRSRNDSDDDMSDNEQGHVDNGVTVPDVSKRPHLQSAHSRSCTGASQNGHSSNLGQKQPGGCIVYVRYFKTAQGHVLCLEYYCK